MLLIDCGNTAVKCRLINGDDIKDRLFFIRSRQGLDEFIEFLKSFPQRTIYLASVASTQTTEQILQIIRQYQSKALVEQLKTLAELNGLTNGYDNHAELGVDRWLTLVAAYFDIDQDVVIIDAGSAITLDLLSQQYGHLGGAILPGLQTDLDRFKGFFPGIDFSHMREETGDKPGRSTADCIQIVDPSMSARYLQQLLEKWTPLLQAPVINLVCGQDAGQIEQALGVACRNEADLVFKGMLKQIELQG